MEVSSRGLRFARIVFGAAGVFGLAALLPMYFLEERLGRDLPPPINHPEHFYGFLGVASAWQVAFLLISGNPLRYRLLMLVGVLEKFSFGGAMLVLGAQGRIPGPVVGTGAGDLAWGLLFALAYHATRGPALS
jgi:hypothetical protein